MVLRLSVITGMWAPWGLGLKTDAELDAIAPAFERIFRIYFPLSVSAHRM